jgi:hypothetical protein
MTTKIGLALSALAVMVPAWGGVRAGQPAPLQTTGKVLVLDNERTLEGDIERLGEQYRVRRAIGELWVQRENVLRLCKDYPEAYAFLRTRANLRDGDEHLRLARWCHQHGLKKEALAEVTEAVRLRPNHPESQRLLRSLERSAAISRAAKATPLPDELETPQSPPPVNTESLGVFVTRIQPILMNACANCHASGRGGALKLTRTYENSPANRKTTLQNLTAVLAKVNPEQPLASLLLTKALSVHGDMAQPAFKGREAPAYRTLEDWVRTTVESSPQLREQASANSAVQRATPPQSQPPVHDLAFMGSVGVTPMPAAKFAADGSPAYPDAKEVGKPSPAPMSTEPVDPFDPLIFNRQMHPQKTGEAKQ